VASGIFYDAALAQQTHRPDQGGMFAGALL
jgi:hypothetical protein